MLYACPNVETKYRLAQMNVDTPTPMRGPGEASGIYALESALDELAIALQIDPIELRLHNHADDDPQSQRPWSSKSLRECYEEAAKRFGWARRNPKPRSMHDGHWLVGYGMATATWPTHRQKATVQVRLMADGSAVIRTASHDIGPGTYTVMSQIAADGLALPVSKIKFELGNSAFPESPVEGGSMTVASVGSAVHDCTNAVRRKLFELARDDERSPLHQAPPEAIAAADGRFFDKNDPARGESFVQILKRHNKNSFELTRESKPGDEAKRFSMRAFGAMFVEVRVDPDLGTIRVARVVGGFGAGRIINPKTANSQAIGGMIGGIGMALLEQVIWDSRNARVVNSNLADYRVPVNADIPNLEAFFVDERDPHVNPLGAKGIAELAIVGVAPAIANAVYHATGKRVRDLPITPEKLL